MPTNNEKPRPENLSSIIEGLLGSGVDFILVGGLATVVQGAPITTMDVDIVHDQSPENIERLYEFLTSIDAFYRRPDSKLIRPTKRHLSGKGHVLLTTKLGPVDVLAVIEQEKSYDDLVDHTVEIKFKDHTLRVLSLETIVDLKANSQYSKDKQRLPVLRETLSQLKEKGAYTDDKKDIGRIDAGNDEHEPTNPNTPD